jgi:hypothetical protein
MSDKGNIPVLTDLIEKGIEIKMSDLGLEDDLEIGVIDPADHIDVDITEPDPLAMDPFVRNPALEQVIRRILDEHTEFAYQEIKLAIQREFDRKS